MMMYRRKLLLLIATLLFTIACLSGSTSAVVSFHLDYDSIDGGSNGDTLLVHVYIDSVNQLGPGGLTGGKLILFYDTAQLIAYDTSDLTPGTFGMVDWTVGVFYPWVINGGLYVSNHFLPPTGRFLFAFGDGIAGPIGASGECIQIRFLYNNGLSFGSHKTWVTIDTSIAEQGDAIRHEVTAAYAPIAPELIEPIDSGNYPPKLDVIFAWTETDGPLGSYEVQVNTDPTFSSRASYNYLVNDSLLVVDKDSLEDPSQGQNVDVTWYWRVRAIDHIGRASGYSPVEIFVKANPTDVGEGGGLLPGQFNLNQNYPNPFNPSTTISFSLETATTASIEIFNVLGQRVKKHSYGRIPAGEYIYVWDGTDAAHHQVASGVYLYRLLVDGQEESRKMMLVR
jgi:hypothetical protein